MPAQPIKIYSSRIARVVVVELDDRKLTFDPDRARAIAAALTKHANFIDPPEAPEPSRIS